MPLSLKRTVVQAAWVRRVVIPALLATLMAGGLSAAVGKPVKPGAVNPMFATEGCQWDGLLRAFIQRSGR